MRDATAEIAAGNQDLSSRTESQASSLEETAASMEQITGTVKLSVDSAQQAAVLAEQTIAVAQRSSEAVGQVTDTMHRISESSHRIGEIIQVIDSIAFQTNILALNAAVEAARAGEQGRGFAVVAAEVRALAQRTTGAAKEIKQLIDESTDKVQAGNRLTEAAQQTMRDALESVRQVGTMIGEISSGAREQLAGISQINEAMAQMDTITQQNAALVEEIAASAMQLQGQASTVAETVQVFRLGHGDVAMQDAVALRRAAKSAGGDQDHDD
jgi:aerotaxis receptor